MSGITGLLTINNNANGHNLKDALVAANTALAHRGPDDEGYVLFDGDTVTEAYGQASPQELRLKQYQFIGNAAASFRVGLAHRRLAVIDTSVAGHQPMHYADKTCWIVFNGEIYNYKDLKQELATLGHTFHSQTDTEVLLAAYKQWGEAFTSRLNGMWAFVIYDTAKQKLFGSRDRFGVKPLYYFLNDEYFAFASEQKALLQYPFLAKKINRAAVWDYLVNGELEKEQSGLIQAIMEVPPATSISYDLREKVFKKWHYYVLGYKPEPQEFTSDKFRKHSVRLRKMMLSNLRRHLQANVPVAASLSGGIDSSAIAVLVQKLLEDEGITTMGKAQELYTIAFHEKRYDESKYAKEIADATHANWHQVYADGKSFIDTLQDVVYTQDVPFLSTDVFAHYQLMHKVSKDGIKVFIDGLGGDEMFSGTPRHHVVFMNELLDQNKFGGLITNVLTANNSFASKTNLVTSLVKHLTASAVQNSSGYAISRNTLGPYKYLRNEFWERYVKRTQNYMPILLNAQLHREYTGHVLKTQLRNADRNSMRFGVENRSPFADDANLAEFIFNLGSVFKVNNGQSKILLRNAVGNNLPKKVLYRRDKAAHITPMNKWISDNRNQLLEMVGSENRDVLDMRAVRDDWNKLLKNPTGEGAAFMWRVINLGIWRKAYGV